MERTLNWKEKQIVNFLVEYVEDAWRTHDVDISDEAYDDPRSIYDLAEFFEDRDFDEDDDEIDWELVDAAALAGVEELRAERLEAIEAEEDEDEDEAA